MSTSGESQTTQEREDEPLMSGITPLVSSSSSKDVLKAAEEEKEGKEEKYDVVCSDGEDELPPESDSGSDPYSEFEDEFDEDELPQAYWDEKESVYRCGVEGCKGEIADSVCAFCGEENEFVSDAIQIDSLPTDSQTIWYDRQIEPRSSTPLLDIPTSDLIIIPLEYRDDRVEEYHQLLRRGATRFMCERFSLDFTQEEGIVAWADEYLFGLEEFGGPEMEDGDEWKIYLGRRIKLDEGDDDGEEFIVGLLEDGILFAAKEHQWTTVKEGPKLWVTRPNLEIFKEEECGSDEVGESEPRPEDKTEEPAGAIAPSGGPFTFAVPSGSVSQGMFFPFVPSGQVVQTGVGGSFKVNTDGTLG